MPWMPSSKEHWSIRRCLNQSILLKLTWASFIEPMHALKKIGSSIGGDASRSSWGLGFYLYPLSRQCLSSAYIVCLYQSTPSSTIYREKRLRCYYLYSSKRLCRLILHSSSEQGDQDEREEALYLLKSLLVIYNHLLLTFKRILTKLGEDGSRSLSVLKIICISSMVLLSLLKQHRLHL